MAIHHPTPPIGGGERPRLPSAQVGPVTQAIRAMRAVDPADQAIADLQDGLDRFFEDSVKSRTVRFSPRGTAQFTHGIRALSRTEVENLVEGLIDLLDGWDGDADREPETDHEPDVDREPEEQDGCAAEWTGRGIHYFNRGVAA
ncbi:hypothetical protein MKL09_26790 [Methylobacterium sp. J-048]|uniref:hypothetical protein n=1 Tax=Methylobacterium sp. J-048 TaxID=2836635 RepID=UPI001FBB98C4|nr:hypothetical protein [Methylobacterium sp. J-048]MCJ2060125.1 hypothetical protein [Methylobacterium sp. J-048]